MELNFKEFGAGEPLIIIHGLFGTADNWQTIAKHLSDNFTVFILDLRNHGRSPHTDELFDYPSLAEDVTSFLTSRWIYEARVVGHSMGGKIAMEMALRHPDFVKKLVVLDIAPKQYLSGHQEIFQALINLDLTLHDERKDIEDYLMTELDGDVTTVQFMLKNLSRRTAEEGGGFEWKMNLPVLYRDYAHILAEVPDDVYDKPTLFVRGSKSNYISNLDFENLKTQFPKAQLQTVEGAGHWIHADKPQETLQILRSFL
jgi:esterase